MVVREGSNVTLKCAATGSPEPTITWRRESGDPISLPDGVEGDYEIYLNYSQQISEKFYAIFAFTSPRGHSWAISALICINFILLMFTCLGFFFVYVIANDEVTEALCLTI